MLIDPDSQVLVLNFDFTPLNIVRGRRAIVLIIKAKAMLISEKVIRLVKFIYHHPISRASREKPTKAAIYRRDNYSCQYCGSTRNLTVDHLVPKSKGGGDTWDNLLLACSKCNTLKGSRSLEQTGFKLKRKPGPPLPKVIEVVQKTTDPEWRQYAYG